MKKGDKCIEEMAELRLEVAKLETEMQDEEIYNDHLKAKVNTLQAELAQARGEVEEIQRREVVLSTAGAKLEAECKSLREQLDAAKEAFEKIRPVITELRMDLGSKECFDEASTLGHVMDVIYEAKAALTPEGEK